MSEDHVNLNDKLDTIIWLLSVIAKMEITMSVELDNLTAAVTKDTEVESSAVILIKGIATQLAAAKTDPVKVQALADQLNTSASALSDAVVANTPAA